MKAAPVIPTDSLTVIVWPDPLIERFGHEAWSEYVEEFWLGVLGPTATWILRRLSILLTMTPEGYVLDLAPFAAEVGIGLRGGRNSPFIKALGRLCQYELAQMQPGGVFALRPRVPTLPQRHLRRLPPHLQLRHAEWERSPQHA
jgi:hypothetical protein